MSPPSYPLRNSGIFRNLPTFDPSLKGLKALVCGGSGISGFHAVRALLDTPERWSTVYVLSRSPLSETLLALLTEDQKKKVQHVSVDLQGSRDEIADKLKAAHVKADFAFFYSYMNAKNGNAMDPSVAQELLELNGPLMDNFLQALPKADIKPRRILLQTGGKNYGVQMGRGRNPSTESDPQPKHLQPNQFYYEQERLLFEYCEKHPETKWNIVMPFAVIGAIHTTWLTAFYSFAVYAAVQAHKGEPLAFGGDFEAWQFGYNHSTARMTGYLSEWAVLSPHTANQRFNATDGSQLTFDRFFHELARWYAVQKGVTLPKLDEERSFPHVIELPGGEKSPLGYGPPVLTKREFTLAEWAGREENKKAWKEIMEQSGGKVKANPFEGSADEIRDTFMGDFCYLRAGTVGQEKLRRFGFTGYVDSVETVFEMYRECAMMGMLPEMKADAAQPLI